VDAELEAMAAAPVASAVEGVDVVWLSECEEEEGEEEESEEEQYVEVEEFERSGMQPRHLGHGQASQ
jgi:hypothetical protein